MNLGRIKRRYDFKGRKTRVKTSGNVSSPIVAPGGVEMFFTKRKNHRRGSTEEDGDTVTMAWWRF